MQHLKTPNATPINTQRIKQRLMLGGQLLMWKMDFACSDESFRFDSSQTCIRLLLLLLELSEVISNFIRAIYFYVSKSTGRNLALQILIQDWLLTSVGLNVHPWDLLSSSSLHCSPGRNKKPKSSEISYLILFPSSPRGRSRWSLEV